jgi:hypothetical protein
MPISEMRQTDDASYGNLLPTLKRDGDIKTNACTNSTSNFGKRETSWRIIANEEYDDDPFALTDAEQYWGKPRRQRKWSKTLPDGQFGTTIIALAFHNEAQIPRKETSVYGLSLSVFSCERVAVSGGLAAAVGVNDFFDFHGAAVTPFYNDIETIRGVSMAGLMNDSWRADGIQLAGLYNTAVAVTGGQIALGMNRGAFRGLQMAGIGNNGDGLRVTGRRPVLCVGCPFPIPLLPVSEGETVSHGLQLAVGFNFAPELTGAQIAMIANDANRLYGVQLGMLNSVKELHGLQVGVYNRAYSGNGVQLGLVNVFGDDDNITWAPIFNARF